MFLRVLSPAIASILLFSISACSRGAGPPIADPPLRANLEHVWQAADGVQLHALTGHASNVWCVRFSPDGQWLATGGDDSTVNLWRLASGALADTLAAGNHTYGLAFSADGLWLIAGGCEKGNIGTLWKEIAGHYLMARSPTVRTWRLRDRALVQGHRVDDITTVYGLEAPVLRQMIFARRQPTGPFKSDPGLESITSRRAD